MKLSVKQTTFVLELQTDGRSGSNLGRGLEHLLLDAKAVGNSELAAHMREMLRSIFPQSFLLH